MIQEIKTFKDASERRVTCRININPSNNEADNTPDIEFYGHGFVPVAALKQMFPFEFKIPVDLNGAKPIYEAAKEAFGKYDELFKTQSVVAVQKIQQKIVDESKSIMLPGDAEALKSAHKVINCAKPT